MERFLNDNPIALRGRTHGAFAIHVCGDGRRGILRADECHHSRRLSGRRARPSGFARLANHSVTVFTDTVKETGALAERLQSADALVLIRERTRIDEDPAGQTAASEADHQTGKGTAHVDLAACTRRGIVVAAGTGSPFAPAELTWALVLASRRRVAEEAARMRAGYWQNTLGAGLRGRTLGVWGYGKIGSLVAGYGRAFSMNVLIWGRESSLSRARADGYAVGCG